MGAATPVVPVWVWRPGAGPWTSPASGGGERLPLSYRQSRRSPVACQDKGAASSESSTQVAATPRADGGQDSEGGVRERNKERDFPGLAGLTLGPRHVASLEPGEQRGRAPGIGDGAAKPRAGSIQRSVAPSVPKVMNVQAKKNTRGVTWAVRKAGEP